MKVLQQIVRKIKNIDGFNPDKDYFDYEIKERYKLVSILWDEIYGEFYYSSLTGKSGISPLETHLDILTDLYYLQREFEIQEQYELCDIIRNLVDITEDKIQQLERYYADTNKKNG